jgi:hypothetical protein
MHGYSVPESDDASVLRGHPAAAWPLCLVSVREHIESCESFVIQGPLQAVPVMARAIAERLGYVVPCHSKPSRRVVTMWRRPDTRERAWSRV